MSVYKDIIKGLDEAIEYEKGKLKSKRRIIEVEPLADFQRKDIKDIRKQLDFSQAVFAKTLGVSLKTVEAWEAGINEPSGPARRMLELFRQDKEIAGRFVRVTK